MKKGLFYLALIAFAAVTLFGSVISCSAEAPDADYQLLLSDEFDGEALDTSIWDYRSGNPYGGKNLKENVRQTDGKLFLDYKIVDGFYTGGGVLTNFNLPYGYYETKAKTFGDTGRFHTSFWLSGGSAFTTTPENFPQKNCMIEIDGFEIDSERPNAISHGIHYWWANHESTTRWNYNEIDTSKEWFTMGMEWLPGRVNFYINGELVNTDDNVRVYGPSYLWLTSVAMPEGKEDLIDPSKVNGSSEFEYFRYYQKPLKNVNLLGNGNFEYDRTALSLSRPYCFITKGDINAAFTSENPYAYDGYCSLSHFSLTPYSVSTGQEFPYLCPGNYTFRGMFKSSGGQTEAKLIVRDKDGSILAEKNIPASTEWKETILTDIPVTGYAYVAVESASEGNTSLLIDDLSFFCQEGEEFVSKVVPDYEKYISAPLTNAYIYTLDDASAKSEGWQTSSLAEDAYFSSEPNAFAEWELSVRASDEYVLQAYKVTHETTTQSQKYTISVNDGEAREIIMDMHNTESGWINLGDYALSTDDKIKIRLERVTPGSYVRTGQLRLASAAELESYVVPAMEIGNNIFTYQNRVYSFDRFNTKTAPYWENETLYIPYRKLKEVTGITAELTNPENPNKQIVLTKNNAKSASEDWKWSSIMTDSYWMAASGNPYAEWECKVPESDTYFLDVYNLIDKNNTATQKYIVTLNGVSETFIVDTLTGKNGWVSLGKYALTPADTLTVRMEGDSKTGNARLTRLLLSAADGYATADQIAQQSGVTVTTKDNFILLHDDAFSLSEKSVNLLARKLQYLDMTNTKIPELMGTADEKNQILFDFDTASKTGVWSYSSLHGGTYYGNNNATVMWNITPGAGRYSVQIFSPTHENSTDAAMISLHTDGGRQTYMLSQKENPGWYDLGMHTFKEGEIMSVFLTNANTNRYLRASSIRLIPCPEISTTKMGSNITVNLGYAHKYANNIFYAIYDADKLTEVQFLTPAEKITFQLPTSTSKYTLFFWEDKTTMRPVFPAKGNR